MLTLIIALLMNLGIISSPADYEDVTPQQQEQYQEIVSEDTGGL